MRPAYLQEEYVPDGATLALQERMANRNQQLSDQRQMSAEEAQRATNRLGVDGIRGLAESAASGVENFADRRQKRIDREEETRRFDVQNEREQDRADRESEEFEYRKPELKVRSETAGKRNAAEMKLMTAQTSGAEAGARSAQVGATNSEKEMSWLESSATGPKARAGENNREFIARMKQEGQENEVALAKAQLESFVAEAPGRKQLQNSQIAATYANTKAQNLANEKAKMDADTERLVAIAKAPTPDQIQALSPHLVSEYKAGRLSPAQASRVIGAISSAKVQAEVQNNLMKTSSPEFQAKFAELEKTKSTLRQSADGLVQMASAVRENDKGIASDEQSIQNFSAALRAMGRVGDAESIESLTPSLSDIEKGNFTKQQRMKAKLNAIAAELRAKPIDPDLRSDPIIQNYLSVLENMGRGNLGGQPTNLFGAPKPSMPAQTPQFNFQGPAQNATPAQPSPSAKPRNSTAANFGGK